MRVLIVSAGGELGQAIALGLDFDHQLRLADGPELPGEDLQAILQDMDAVVHTGEPPAAMAQSPNALLDWYTRGTYDLMAAAVAEGVRRFVYCSTLDLFGTYPSDVHISELHEPFPPAQSQSLLRYLAELTVREFTRDHAITATALRLGTLVDADAPTSATVKNSAIDPRDAASAVRAALNRNDSDSLNWVRRWGIYHVCADHPNPRFLIDRARALGFKPQHRFASPKVV
ncbi:MAG: NAD(P)-dependent oxidoreductase [Candidatus Latescibacterota bacterium]|nr:NAD(P)-dependent oxidoreductase [Candidatus Latescibacterota bacterium]